MDRNLCALPDIASPETLFAHGMAAYGRGDNAEAAACFTAVLAALPGFAAALVNRALALWSLGALDAAERDADAACAAEGARAEAWMVAGAIRIDRGDAAGAMASYRRAVALRPDFPPARAGLAASFLAAGRHAEAVAEAEAALALDPACTHARFTHGSALSALGQIEPAIAAFDRVLAAEPGHAGAHLNRGNALINLDGIEAGTAELRAAVTLNPRLKEAWASLGVALTIAGDTTGAIAACDRAIMLDADFAVAHWNRGVAALLAGDFATGFAEYEWRKRHPLYGPHFDRLPAPAWDGSSLEGRHLLVRAEQGLGDTIMFARFLPRLAARARRVTLACERLLFPLFAGLGIGLCRLDEPGHPDADVAIDQMSLPHVLGLMAETIPNADGYLSVPEARGRRWQAAMPKAPDRRLFGLVWAGNPGHSNDTRRSLPPGILASLLGCPGIDFVALQLGARRDEYGAHGVPSFAPMIADFGTTAEILGHLDGIVCVDTSIAHLAGAMGKECHVLLSAACDWRWLHGRDTTPWYDSICLHRQRRLGDWSGPLDSVMAALEAGARKT